MTMDSRILLRLPSSLHRLVKAQAAQLSVSVNSFLERLIQQGLEGDGDKQMEALIINKASEMYGDDFVGLLLFGSQARGDAHDLSDTDLLLVLSTRVQIERDLYRAWDRLLPPGVSLHLAHLLSDHEEPGSLWLECALDARILFDPTGVLRMKIRALKNLITSGRIVRRITHGQGYWVPQ